MPGLEPRTVHENGVPKRFDTEDKAETAGMWALTAAIQSRVYDERKPGPYRYSTPAELAILIEQAGITLTEFGVLGGWPQSRVMKWVEGESDIPHYAAVLAKLIVSPINLAEARAFTNTAMKGAIK
jgi:hypothetical protein